MGGGGSEQNLQVNCPMLYISVSDPLHLYVDSDPRIHFLQLQIRIRSKKLHFFLIIFVKDIIRELIVVQM